MTDNTDERTSTRLNALGRVQPAAITLLVINIVNLLLAGWMLNGAVTYVRMEDDEFQKFVKEAWDNLDPGQRQTLVNQGWTLKSFDELMRKLMGTIAAWMGGCVFFAILSIIGAIGMLKLRRRGLAITAAILTTIPGVTCLSCALIGEGIGIWCMVVLFSSDVSAGFAANRAEADAPPDDAWPTDRGSEGFRE